MFLKSLTLKGFKSFAETSTLEFEPGVTVVVGPNGSGKSNIVDAVAWVLGAQGPRSLRSAKMEDVIFAGASRRPTLGRAEVSLTIDNSAGLLPIDFSEVRITRALWRSGESEYSINGAPCRLLDVQELVSDTGVGRQQHTIISQLQLDAILSARPEERRAVIEEAAGISKHRRRKEKAERRLEATESASLRAHDLVKEVRRQLRPLERQAEAARRHGDVAAELVCLRRYLYGREVSALVSRLGSEVAAKADLARAGAGALEVLARLDASVLAAEASLDASRRRAGVTDLAELVSSAEALRARAAGTLALLEERARGVGRERAATVDGDVIASLEAEAASLSGQLLGTEREAGELLPLEAEVSEAEETLARETAGLEATFAARPEPWAGAAAQAPAAQAPAAERAGEVRAELSALHRAEGQLASELGRLEDRAGAIEARRSRLQTGAGEAVSLLESCEAQAGALAQLAEVQVGRLVEAESALAAAEQARRAADAARHRWSARVEALSQALDEARARAGARRLAGIGGMVGALVELVEVEEGFEGAFEAAAGEVLSAVLMEGEEPARRGLAHLAAHNMSGAVIALGGTGGAAVGRASTAVPGDASVPPLYVPLPPGAQWLRGRVRARDEAVTGLLDKLLAAAVTVEGGWPAAVDLALARPELVVVTRSGDRCAGGIWRTGSGGTGATGAALEEARAAVGGASATAEAAEDDEQGARAALEEARSAAAEARRQAADNAAVLRRAAEGLERADADLQGASAEMDAVARQREELRGRRGADAARVDELQAALPGLEAAADEEGRRAAAERAARTRLAERSGAVATLRRELEVRATGIEQRRALLGRRLAEVEKRLEGNRAERERAAVRRAQLEVVAGALDRMATFVQGRLVDAGGALARLRERRRAQADELRLTTDHLEDLRRQRTRAERELSGLRDQLSRAEVGEAQLRARVETITEAVRRDLDCEPEALQGAECPELPPGTSAPNRARELERELRLMGPVNPLALEEYAALRERHEFLEGQLHDVTAARRELAKVIKAVDAEIITVFKAAYDDVAENFAALAATLFPGGHGALSLSDPSNVLGSGVELELKPAGKNVRRLSLLSGGERSLVALAFLFAVFRSRPSPFYMMDEVESALDDVNLHRFLGLVNEFREEAQLLIVSHQKRTMEAADCLYGVSMPPGGSSLVVSEKVDRPH
ncbi:MAG: chromosome segregation protein SMC, partial [Acidimicrobiales bacterium]